MAICVRECFLKEIVRKLHEMLWGRLKNVVVIYKSIINRYGGYKMENLASAASVAAEPTSAHVVVEQTGEEAERTLPTLPTGDKGRTKQQWYAWVRYKDQADPQIIEAKSRIELRKMLNEEADKIRNVYFACRGHEVKIREKRSLFL
jgi:hypothetical protein